MAKKKDKGYIKYEPGFSGPGLFGNNFDGIKMTAGGSFGMEDLGPKKNNLIPDPHRFPVSRDFEQTMRCDNTVCPYHDRYRRCSSPSVVKIGAGGLCVPYQEWLTKSVGGK